MQPYISKYHLFMVILLAAAFIIIDQEYNIPVRVWLQRGYPKEKPLVYINPTSDMAIASVGYVDRDGKVGVSYLSEWKEVSI